VADQGKYQAVVLATGDLVYCDAGGCYSALDATEWGVLNSYQAKFGVRRVTAYAWPNPAYGLNYPFQSGDISGATGTLTAAGATAMPYLVGTVPYDVGTWGYYAEPLPVAAGAVNPFTTLVAGPVGPGGTAASVAGVYARPDGFEELVITASSNAYQSHHLLPIHGFISWATRGIQLGHLRYYFTMHIDDIFLPDDRWDMVANFTYEDDGLTNPLIRMVPSDVDRLMAWQNSTGIKLDMVYNGSGSDEAVAANGSDPLTTKFLANKSKFYWINHTYAHHNLDTFTAAQIADEIKKNFSWASAKKIAVNKTELVTGEHSGLGNPELPVALAGTQVKWLASDNSKQPTPYTIGQATTIPRHPSNLYYNVGTVAEQLDEYNYIYFENCTNTAVTTCFSAPATWAQYTESEAAIMFRHVLTNDPRPHYIHQANLAEDGTAYPVLDTLVARFKQYVKAPIVQPYFRDAGKQLGRQSAWATAMPGMASAYYQGGYIYLKSPVGVYAPVTGTTTGTLYGGQRSAWVWLAANTTKTLAVQTTF